jgi:hypothetical protein
MLKRIMNAVPGPSPEAFGFDLSPRKSGER